LTSDIEHKLYHKTKQLMLSTVSGINHPTSHTESDSLDSVWPLFFILTAISLLSFSGHSLLHIRIYWSVRDWLGFVLFSQTSP